MFIIIVSDSLITVITSQTDDYTDYNSKKLWLNVHCTGLSQVGNYWGRLIASGGRSRSGRSV